VKIRGHRIELPEIEAVLARQSGVREAVVVAREDAFGVKRLSAYVVAQPGASLDVDRLHAAAQATLPNFMVPADITLIEAMPLTPNGKIDRAALPEPALHAVTPDTGHVPPQGAIEGLIATIWQEALNVPRISRTANFFQLGGDSLLAVAVHRKLCDALEQELPITDIFSSRTLADLAQKFNASRRTEAAPWSPLVALAPEGAGAPLFIVHGLTGIVLNLSSLGRRIGASRSVWGLQARGLDGVEPAFTRVEDMAAYYISHMRQVQPRGPYMIAGFCFGGLVAYEMARELVEIGETVAFLGLLNSSFHYRFLTPLGRVRFQVAKELIHLQTIRRLSGRERMSYMSSRLGARLTGVRLGTASLPYVDHLPDGQDVPPELEAVTAAAERAFYDYEPPAYSGAVTYFQPMSRDFRNILEFAPEWRGKAAGVETLLVPGDHLTMLDPPAIDIWGAALGERLDRISRSN
jgi:thioesterase domain-containing protein/acyl carrier protein